MKIGIFSETYTPETNGIVTSIVNFKRELEAAGHTVYVFAPGYKLISIPRRRKQIEKNVFRFNSFQYPLYKDWRIAIPVNISAQRKLKRLGLDVVHSQHPFSMGLFAMGVARQLKIPHVHTYHTLYPEYAKLYFPGFKRWNEKGAEKWSQLFCNRADHVVAPSEGIKEKLISYGITTPITVIPTGIEARFFKAQPSATVRKRYGIPEDAPLVITVARLGKEKGIDFVLRSFKEALKHQPDAHYAIVGDGPAKYDLETLARELGIYDRVTFTGMVTDRDDIRDLYASASVFAYAALTDTQCLTLLEAAATKLPLVARYDKPLETALTDNENGFFIQSADEKRFARRLDQVLSDSALHKRFSNASYEIAKRQSAKERALELVDVYGQAIAAKQSARSSS